MAMPRSSAAKGRSTRAETRVNTTEQAASRSGPGAGFPMGHAARRRRAVIVVRTTLSAASSSAKACHEGWKTRSQRRSWKTPNGAGAEACGASAWAPEAPISARMSASSTGSATARTMSPGWAPSDGQPHPMTRPRPTATPVIDRGPRSATCRSVVPGDASAVGSADSTPLGGVSIEKPSVR